MTRLLMFVGSTVGSALGWWLGAHVGVMTAFVISMVGLGVGMWAGRRVADQIGG